MIYLYKFIIVVEISMSMTTCGWDVAWRESHHESQRESHHAIIRSAKSNVMLEVANLY